MDNESHTPFEKSPVSNALGEEYASLDQRIGPTGPAGESNQEETMNQAYLELRQISRRCHAMLYETTKIRPFLSDRELIQAGDSERISSLAQMLSKDISQLTNELRAIEGRLPLDKGAEALKEYDAMKLIAIGDEFNSWQDRFIGTVIPTFQDLVEQIQAAAAQLDRDIDVPSSPATTDYH
jgi:hypothetical protein